MGECFKVDELMANVKKLSNENDELRMKISDLKAEVEEARAYAQDRDKRMEKLRMENRELLCQLEEVQTTLKRVSTVNDLLKKRLKEKETMSVKDLMGTLSKNGAQSVLIGFK